MKDESGSAKISFITTFFYFHFMRAHFNSFVMKMTWNGEMTSISLQTVALQVVNSKDTAISQSKRRNI